MWNSFPGCSSAHPDMSEDSVQDLNTNPSRQNFASFCDGEIISEFCDISVNFLIPRSIKHEKERK
jgi:hypothetical protein